MNKRKYDYVPFLVMKINLFDDLTVFIICFKKKQFVLKKKKLLRKCPNLLIKPIISVFPMSEAFNEMHRRCNTKYFLQLDEDMQLKDNSIKILLSEIKNSNIFTICVAGQLYEPSFGIGGAIKIWKSKVFKYFEFSDHRTVDRNYFKKLFFVRKKIVTNILGYHEPRFSNFNKFSKVLGDICKWKFLNSKKKYLYKMLNRVLIEKNFYEIFALYISLNVSNKFIIKSKNYQNDQVIFNRITKLKKNFSNFYLNNKKNNIMFFNIFIDAFNNKNKREYFNSYFIKNFFKKNLITSKKMSLLTKEPFF
jgi:hypothetical protein